MICPHCGRNNQRTRNTQGDDEDQPVTGDLSLCWHCRNVAIFIDSPHGLSLRLPTDEELSEIMSDPDVREVLNISAESYTPSAALNLMRQGNK